MKLARIYLMATLLAITSLATAQSKVKFEPAQDEKWLVDVEEAYKLSKETNRPILANFTGSDWCGWCKKLRAEVFSQPEFKEWADENVVLLELDFPRRKKLPQQQVEQNRGLQQAFQVRGYPTIWVFALDRPEDSQQFALTAYGKTGYIRGGASKFTSEVEKMLPK